ncbi:winged helix-turn-helix domain-containing protein [Pseudoalteromonas rubra]|uniref:winged helix-turn-helix domain-containing protein n=1 Tax=Pseudoalteromonas rubra TaxID=43658 RepID=UPI000F790335|nr:winged helix-turn-helix domain-containing protein [Pseudoalteromonas rubra]
MRWQIEQFTFCDQTLTLSWEEQKISLEPMVSEVLSFFCQNPHTLISRDDLIEHVWQGRIVTDNAVNRVITKLRKALNDDPRSPAFIVTYPKKGYQFIASISAITSNLQSSDDATKVSSKEKETRIKLTYATLILMTAICILGAAYFLHQAMPTADPQRLNEVSALTREPGLELYPRLSPDEQYLLFTEAYNDGIVLKLKSLITGEVVNLDHGPDTWEGPADWRKDGKALVYLATTANSCQYYLRTFDAGKLGPPQLIHNCPTGSYGKIIFTHNHDLLIYSEAAYQGGPFSLFSLRLSSGEKKRLVQPLPMPGRNSQFDLHPTRNLLLISAPDAQFWPALSVLNITQNQLSRLFTLNQHACCAIWNHTGDRVIITSDYPANQLVSYDLNGQSPTVIYTDTHSISTPARHPNGQDYLFSTGSRDKNILYLSSDSSEQTALGVTSVDERLARFSDDGQKVAYISLASGSEQIWIYDLAEKTTSMRSKFDKARHILDLKWSIDNRFIFALAHNELLQIDTQTGLSKTLKVPHGQIAGLSVKDNDSIAFSIKSADKWQVHYYNIRTDELHSAQHKWQFVSFAKTPEDTVWQDNNGDYFTGLTHLPVTSDTIKQVPLIAHYRFNLRKQANTWLWQHAAARRYPLYQYDEQKQTKRLIATSDSSDFDWYQNKILINTLHYESFDIYRSKIESTGRK